MSGRRKVLTTIVAIVLIAIGAAGLRLLPIVTGPGLPAGATRLHIVTEQPNINLACMTAQLLPVRVAISGEDVVLVNVESGDPVDVVWPSGFAAWRANGQAVIADPWGSIVGREGDVLNSLGGGNSGSSFHICPLGIVTKG
jgi:hypothetical protein